MDILETIVANKRLEVARQKEAVSLDLLLRSGSQRMSRPTISMRQALEKSPSGIIAEFKRRSPSKGWLYPDAKVACIVPAYAQGGASACSILTDSDFFGGSFRDLQKARAWVSLPLLQKDFIIDEYQLYQARVMGADAVLLIAACLTPETCRHFAKTAHQLDLEVLLEIHREAELVYVSEHIDMLGINNRNLGTFHTDIATSFNLIECMKSAAGANVRPGTKSGTKSGSGTPLFVSESGISDPKVIKELRHAGFRGFLIGETFMKTHNPGETLTKFIQYSTTKQIGK